MAALHLPGAEILTVPVRKTNQEQKQEEQNPEPETPSAREELPPDPQTLTPYAEQSGTQAVTFADGQAG